MSTDGEQPGSETLISVIIPHFEDFANLERCLECLSGQTFPRAQFEIIVSDNNSPSGVEAVMRCVDGRGKVVLAREQGAGPARNAGVEQARGDVLAFMDSDCRPDPTYLSEGYKWLAPTSFTGGMVRVDVENRASITPAEAFELVFAFRNERYIKQRSFTVTASLFVRRADFMRAGPFKKGVPEDVEWCHRAISRGLIIDYVPTAIIGHPARRTWHELERKWRRLTSEAFERARKERFGTTKWLLRAWIVLFSAIPHLRHVWQAPQLASANERLKAASVLLRLRLMRFIWAHSVVFPHAAK